MRLRIARALDGDLFQRFLASPVAVFSAILLGVLLVGAFGAPILAPHDIYDSGALYLSDAFLPPAWEADGRIGYLLGADDQGRDVLSSIMYGMRLSLIVGVASILLAVVLGVSLGLAAGYLGGWVDALIMRVADIQLSFPAILVALLIDGLARAALAQSLHDQLAIYVLILAIGLSSWVQFARAVRGSTMIEKDREYVQAARLIGVHPIVIMLRHVLPNVMGPVLVIATLNLVVAILSEATLSFLGVGLPPTQPSLGALIRIGNDFLFSGEWWMTVFPASALALLALAVNLLGDWLRDALNPRLR